MKKIILSVIIIFSIMTSAYCQDEAEQKEKDKPVRTPWSSGTLIDQQTSFIPEAKTFETVIQHRFGSIQSSMSDVYGIFSPGANLRIGFNYVLFKNIQVGYGLTKKNMYNDFNLKWTLLEQTRENKVPISVTLYGNAAISGNADKTYGLEYMSAFRYSYFSQFIIGRKFCEAFSLQTAVSFSHYNWLPSRGMDHDIMAWHLGGRLKFSPQSSLIFNYDLPLQIKGLSEQLDFLNHPKANLSIGYEVSTGTHAFEFFITTATGIMPQDIVVYNQNKWENGGFAFGFLITRLWGF